MRVLLVDDHAIVRGGVRGVLSDVFPGAEFGEASTVQEAIDAVRATVWDVVILDISMPERSGLDALVEIRAIAPTVPVLMMTMYAEEQYAFRAFRNGASGYITKDAPADEVLAAVQKVVEGGHYVTRALSEHLITHLMANAEKPRHETLSTREFQVVRMLATGETVKGIAAGLHLSEKTVSTYRSRVLAKMHMRGTAALIRYAVRANLVD